MSASTDFDSDRLAGIGLVHVRDVRGMVFVVMDFTSYGVDGRFEGVFGDREAGSSMPLIFFD